MKNDCQQQVYITMLYIPQIIIKLEDIDKIILKRLTIA